ncbi:MFS transporter [Treponema sp.]
MLGTRVDMVLSGLRPAVLIDGFKKRLSWVPSPDLSPQVAAGLRAYRYDGLFASLSDNLAINFFEIFLVALGGGSREIGAMASIANLFGFLSLAPGVLAVRLLGKRKPVVLFFGGGIGRLMYLAIALIPFFFPEPYLAVPAMIAFNGIRIFMGNFSNPAWTSMTADLVSEKSRGSYFASRNTLIAIFGSIASLGAGWIVIAGNKVVALPQFGFVLLFALTFIIGMVSTYFFSKVPDLGEAISPHRRPFNDLIRGFLGYPAFLFFLLFTFIWNFALQISGPFFNVYLMRELGASPAMVGLAATSGNLAQAIALPFWGRRVDKRGELNVLLITGFLIPLLPLSWVFATEAWHPFLINTAGGFLWAGFNLANFNFLLRMIPPSDRQEGAAAYQALILLSTVLGPLVGAELAIRLSYKATFIASSLFRYAALFVLFFGVVRRFRKVNV